LEGRGVQGAETKGSLRLRKVEVKMRRVALIATLAVGVLALSVGVAFAEVDDGPGHFFLEDDWFVLDANNQPTDPGDDGPRARVEVDFSCTDNEEIGIAVILEQQEDGRNPLAGGVDTETCTGGDQTTQVLVRTQQGAPDLDPCEEDTELDLIAATDLRDREINDVDVQEEFAGPAENCPGGNSVNH
jgi:hypothetical protein